MADNTDIVRRIEARLAAVDKTPAGASREAGLGPDAIRDLKRKPEVMPRLDTLAALASVLDTTPEWLAFAITSKAFSASDLTVLGEVAAGVWHDSSEAYDEPAFPSVPGATSPRWPADAQFGLVVRGTSINKQAVSGDVLRCIDVMKTGILPRDKDLVIVERRRPQFGQREVTAKIFRNSREGRQLWPDSTDPRWKEPLRIDLTHEDEDVRILAVVDQIIRQLRDDD